MRLWPHKRHPIPRPYRQDKSKDVWFFYTKRYQRSRACQTGLPYVELSVLPWIFWGAGNIQGNLTGMHIWQAVEHLLLNITEKVALYNEAELLQYWLNQCSVRIMKSFFFGYMICSSGRNPGKFDLSSLLTPCVMVPTLGRVLLTEKEHDYNPNLLWW